MPDFICPLLYQLFKDGLADGRIRVFQAQTAVNTLNRENLYMLFVRYMKILAAKRASQMYDYHLNYQKY
jgi:hypothetical protein